MTKLLSAWGLVAVQEKHEASLVISMQEAYDSFVASVSKWFAYHYLRKVHWVLWNSYMPVKVKPVMVTPGVKV